MIDAVAQSADPSVKEIVDYTIKAALLFACGFMWRTQGVLIELRTLLKDPDQGLLAEIRRMSKRLDGTEEETITHSSRLDVHGTRLDGHDSQIKEINEERRHFTRRASDRARDDAR